MRYLIAFLVLVLVGCHRTVDPTFEEPPIGTSFITVEYDGKQFNYVDGKNGVKSLGRSFGAFSNDSTVAGLGEALEDTIGGTTWTILMYFTPEELRKNTGNFTKLFDAGSYDYLLLDKNFSVLGNRGAVISTVSSIDSIGYGVGNTTLIEKDDRPRLFQIEKAYFYNLTYDELIWVEGTFDGWMSNDQRIKGKFRIKVQHFLGNPPKFAQNVPSKKGG
jgi:hypothetical protein